MFDLFRRRDRNVRIMLTVLLGIIAIMMVVTLIPSMPNLGNGGNEQVVAEVDGDKITAVEVQRLIQLQLSSRQIPAEVLPQYVPTMIDEMVTQRALVYQAKKLGIQVSNADVADEIRTLVPNLYPEGKFVGTQVYAQMLAQRNMTIDQFEEDIRRQILITRLRNIAMEGTIVTPAEIEVAFKKKAEQLKIEWVKLTADQYKKEATPTEAEMRDYFKANAAGFAVPEKRNLTVLIADQNKIEAGLNPSDNDLRQIYNANQESFRTPEQARTRHILIMTQGKPPADEPKLKAKAEDILKQVKAGGDFAKLAKENSDDPGSKDKGGEYTIGRDAGFVKEYIDAAFSQKPGDTTMFKSQFGYHIFQVMERNAAGVKPFEAVKNDIATQWKKQKANELMQKASDQAPVALKRDPANPEKVAAEFNMQVVKVDGYTGGDIAELGPGGDFTSAVAGLKKGEVSSAVTANNKVAVAVVNDVTPSRPMTFEEAQNQIKDRMTTTRSQTALDKHAKELIDRATATPGDFAKIAKGMGLETKTSATFERSGTVDGLGTAAYVASAFDKPEGAIFGPARTPDGATIIGKVVAHIPADMSKLDAQRATVRDEIKSKRAGDRSTLFELGLKEALQKSGKIKINKDVMDRVIAGYRS